MTESGYRDTAGFLRLHGTTVKPLAVLRFILKALFSLSGLFIHAALLWATVGLPAPCSTRCLPEREQQPPAPVSAESGTGISCHLVGRGFYLLV